MPPSATRAVFAFLFLLLAWSVASPASANATNSTNVLELLLSIPELSTYATVLQSNAEFLAISKNSSSKYTFFAPTNKAFTAYLKKLNTTSTKLLANKQKVLQVLEYHTLLKLVKVNTTATKSKQYFHTLLPNATIYLQRVKKSIKANQATIAAVDKAAGESFIEVIDKVLIPPTPKPTNTTKYPSPAKSPSKPGRLARQVMSI